MSLIGKEINEFKAQVYHENEFKTVTKEEIINVSKKVHIDTIYLLEGVNEDGEN